jgi:hypothetical protein
MLKRGVNPKLVQLQLGHDTYSHSMPGERMGLSGAMVDFIADGKRANDAKRAASAPVRVQ